MVTVKGGRSRRILLTAPMQAVLEQAGPRRDGQARVFRNGKGGPWTCTWLAHHLDHVWRTRLQAAGVPRFTAHSLRHWHGDTAAALGFSRDLIQAAMGHLSSQTADAYVHPEELRAKQVHDRIGETFVSLFAPKVSGDAGKCREETGEVVCPHCGGKFKPGKDVASQFANGERDRARSSAG
jgi:integrase